VGSSPIGPAKEIKGLRANGLKPFFFLWVFCGLLALQSPHLFLKKGHPATGGFSFAWAA